jgi:hypothetical protein
LSTIQAIAAASLARITGQALARHQRSGHALAMDAPPPTMDSSNNYTDTPVAANGLDPAALAAATGFDLVTLTVTLDTI